MAFDKHASPDTKQYHIPLWHGEIRAQYVFLHGDPFRTDLIASFLEDAKLIAHNREHKTWTGTLCGEKVSVTSTGMGCPSTAIAVEELIKARGRYIYPHWNGRPAGQFRLRGGMTA